MFGRFRSSGLASLFRLSGSSCLSGLSRLFGLSGLSSKIFDETRDDSARIVAFLEIPSRRSLLQHAGDVTNAVSTQYGLAVRSKRETQLVSIVYLACSVCLVYSVYFVYLVCLVCLVCQAHVVRLDNRVVASSTATHSRLTIRQKRPVRGVRRSEDGTTSPTRRGLIL